MLFALAAIAVGIAVPTEAGAYNISGTVTAGGKGLYKATVTLTGAAGASTMTDGAGAYSFSGLSDGAYTVTPSYSGYAFSPANAPVTVNGSDMTGVNFVGSPLPTYSISGTVTLDGAGLGYINIKLNGMQRTSTNSSGSYTISSLSDGSYTVQPSSTVYSFSPSSTVVTVSGGNVSGVNFSATLIPSYSISGTITLGGAALPGITVSLGGPGTPTVQTDGDGNYSFSGVYNGSYTVLPSSLMYSFSPVSSSATVNNSNVTGLDFAATRLTSFVISGRAADSKGVGYSGVQMRLTGTATQSTATDGSGNYSFTDLANGSYTVTPYMLGYAFSPMSISVTINGASVIYQNFVGSTATAYNIDGSDTLADPLVAAIAASGAQLRYRNSGSGIAENAMNAGGQSIGPMSRNFRQATLDAHLDWTPAVKNVIGLDAAVVVVKNTSARCKNLSIPTDLNDPKSAQENNLLQLVLGGVGGEGTILACADPARLQAIVDFTNCFVGLDRVEHFYRPDDRSGTAEVIKQKLKIKRFCNGTAPGPTNLDAQDNDPIRYPCIPADDTRAMTKCSLSNGGSCTAGTEGCTQGLVVALSAADPNTTDVTVSLSRRVKNDSASVAFAGRQAVKQAQSPTNGVNINTISYAPQNIRLDQYMLSRRLYLMKAVPTSDPNRNLQEERLYDWATNPDNEVPGRCNMDPLMVQYGYVPCTDDCSPPSGANSLCVKTPFAPAPEPAAACIADNGACTTGDVCCGGGTCSGGLCPSASARPEGFACSIDSQCVSPLVCLQGDWPVTTCSP
jgi:inhibitor of cysteine peptidase